MFDEEDKVSKIMMIVIFALAIFITGVQIGIAHGRELQRQEYYDYLLAD